MKATIDSLKRGGVVLGAFLCATMGMPTFGAVDITDFIRSCGTGNYHVRCGNGTKSYASVDTAFDGITSGGDSSPDTRVLLCTTNSGGATIPTPVSLLYYIDEGVLSHYDFKVTAFTLYRLMSGYYYMQRSSSFRDMTAPSGISFSGRTRRRRGMQRRCRGRTNPCRKSSLLPHIQVLAHQK